jgi:hypothetical protein
MKIYGGVEVKLHNCVPGHCMRAVSFTTPMIYPQDKSLQYPLDRKLDVSHIRPGSYGVQKNILPLPKIEPRPTSP